MNRRTKRPISVPVFATWESADRPLDQRVGVSIHRGHCHRYAICQQEAPGVFELTADGRLVYDPSPPAHLLASVKAAVRACPMQAITLRAAEGSAAITEVRP